MSQLNEMARPSPEALANAGTIWRQRGRSERFFVVFPDAPGSSVMYAETEDGLSEARAFAASLSCGSTGIRRVPIGDWHWYIYRWDEQKRETWARLTADEVIALCQGLGGGVVSSAKPWTSAPDVQIPTLPIFPAAPVLPALNLSPLAATVESEPAPVETEADALRRELATPPEGLTLEQWHAFLAYRSEFASGGHCGCKGPRSFTASMVASLRASVHCYGNFTSVVPERILTNDSRPRQLGRSTKPRREWWKQ